MKKTNLNAEKNQKMFNHGKTRIGTDVKGKRRKGERQKTSLAE